jgi:deoxyribodipyrimidine photolyase-related protein
MSNYCQDCKYSPEQRTGPTACPVTTLYWHFLDTHSQAFERNPRTALMAKNLARLDPQERQAVARQAQTLLDQLDDL